MADNPTSNINPEYAKEGFGANNTMTEIHPVGNASEGILDQTFGEVLQTNPQAQQMIMRSMGITPEKFQEMLASAQGNNMMNMKIRDLLQNGVVQQAVMQQQVSPEQVQQMAAANGGAMQGIPVQPQKQSFLEKLKSWLK